MDDLRDRLLAEMRAIRTVDCHSHTCLRRDYYAQGPRSLFDLMSYFERDLQGVAGCTSAELYADAVSDEERWNRLKRVIASARNVSYWRHNVTVYRELFGMVEPEVGDANWRALNRRIKSATADPGWYEYVTSDVCGLETQIRNIPWFEDWEPEYFTAVLRMEPALELHRPSPRQALEEHLHTSIEDLPGLKRALADLVEEYRMRGAVGIKLAHAYSRTLACADVPEPEAAALLRRALLGEELSPAEAMLLQDHVVDYLAGLAGELGLVFQIHTGVQTNWGHIPDSDPLLLLPLLRRHRSTRFDLFHAGYPYSREIGMLGKHYPNVWLNMAWMYVVTMEGSRQTLKEWLDLVPGDRILGFGSDVGWPEFIHGHLVMARACLADVLAEKVREDFLSEEVAFDLARGLLRGNAMSLYGLGTESQ